MAAEPLPPPEIDDDDEGGGPVKPFLEHLEDLRWTIIKVLCAVIVSMIVCMVAGNRLVRILAWPLKKAQELNVSSSNRTAVVRMGESVFGRLPLAGLDSNLWQGYRSPSFSIVPAPSGTNLLLTLRLDTNAMVAGDPGMVSLKNYSPIGGIMVALKLALFGGLSLSAPLVMLFIGQFVVPALKMKEKRMLYRALGVGIGLFIAGVVFCYFVIMQITLLATVQFSQWLGFAADEWRAEDYIDFVVKMMLAVGLSFQLPVILLTLVKIGILDYPKLSKWRSYFIVINMVVCAVITPSGDPFTMLLLAVPVQVLYELSVVIAWVWWRRERRELALAEAGGTADGV